MASLQKISALLDTKDAEIAALNRERDALSADCQDYRETLARANEEIAALKGKVRCHEIAQEHNVASHKALIDSRRDVNAQLDAAQDKLARANKEIAIAKTLIEGLLNNEACEDKARSFIAGSWPRDSLVRRQDLDRANERIAALERERDEIMPADYLLKQRAAAEAALRKIAHDMQNVARAYFTAKGKKP